MRMLVIGSSDTSGSNLGDRSLAWPHIVGKELSDAIGQAVEVVNLPVVHVGPKAVPRVEDALAKHEPDLVVFGYGAYSFIIATVGERVRRRYGQRAYNYFHKLELRFDKKTANPDGSNPARLNRWGRWLSRRIIGVETPASREEVAGIQAEILRLLSRREGMAVVLLGAPDVPDSLVRENKKANILLGQHREYMSSIGREHRFLIADCVEDFRTAPNRDALSTSDGIHKSAAGHRLQANAVVSALLSAPSPYAAAT